MSPMMRINEDALLLHLEVALAVAAPAQLNGLADSDRRRRRAATADIARHLAARLHRFDIRYENDGGTPAQQSLFPDDIGPIG